MKILVVHNAYQQRGGEDGVVVAEIELLRSKGHEVETYFKHNDEIKNIGKSKAIANLFWSTSTTKDIKAIIDKFKPDIIHAHNIFPLISPSLYWVASRENIPVVQTLHNFRLMCLNGVYLRDGKVCEDCTGKAPLQGIVHKCYRNSYAESAALAGMLMLHRSLGSYQNKVSKYIALNNFCKAKFLESGIKEEKISVKPNFVSDYPLQNQLRNGFLFVGRLSPEKGIPVLIEAAKKNKQFTISIVGTGKEIAELKNLKNISFLGTLNSVGVREKMRTALALVVPSIWYENMPLTLLEAFATGLPVIASNIGALAELVEHNHTGLLFEPGNAEDLAKKMQWAQENPEKMKEMGVNARKEYELKYTASKNYDELISIYNEILQY